MKGIKTTLLLLLIVQAVSAQEDTLFSKTLNELVVTATRTERKLGNVAVPVRIIQQKTIQQAGSLRLKDILQEQTGLIYYQFFWRRSTNAGIKS